MGTVARLGLMGGTFDPIHRGHLDAARAARHALQLDEVWLIPSMVPPHRTPGPRASVYHRFAMVALAALGETGLHASDLELGNAGPSYTAETLRRLREAGYRPLQLFFIAGADAFAEIATWRDYPALLALANFVVVSRPGVAATALGSLVPALATRMTTPAALTSGQPAIVLIEAATADISSTTIRGLAARGASLAGLVPPDVEEHIRRHRLYASSSTADDLHGQG